MDNLMLRRRLMMVAKGIWQTVTGTTPLSLQNALKSKMRSIIQYGKMVQDGTPTPDAPVYPSINNGVVKCFCGNQFTSEGALEGYIISENSGNFSTNSSYRVTAPIRLRAGSYQASFTEAGTGARYFRCWEYEEDGTTPIARVFNAQTNGATRDFDFSLDHDALVRISYRYSFRDMTIIPDNPTIYTDGEETLTVSGANLFNPATVPDEFAYVNKSTGRTISNENFHHSDFIPITGGVAYYFGIQSYSASTAGLAWYSDADDETYISGVAGTALANNDMVATAPADARYVRFSIRVADDPNWDTTNYFCVNGTLDAYQPYTAPQTATVPDLFAVGDYADEVDVVSGPKTRKVGMKVLTGEETLIPATSGNRIIITISDILTSGSGLGRVVCSHYPEATSGDHYVNHNFANKYVYMHDVDLASEADWRAYLAAQYAAGTPVIVWYPLATPTTESIAPQELSTVKGNNVIDATSDIAPFDVSVTYKASA